MKVQAVENTLKPIYIIQKVVAGSIIRWSRIVLAHRPLNFIGIDEWVWTRVRNVQLEAKMWTGKVYAIKYPERESCFLWRKIE